MLRTLQIRSGNDWRQPARFLFPDVRPTPSELAQMADRDWSPVHLVEVRSTDDYSQVDVNLISTTYPRIPITEAQFDAFKTPEGLNARLNRPYGEPPIAPAEGWIL